MVGIPRSAWIVAGLAFLVVSLAAVAFAVAWEMYRDWKRRQTVQEQLREVAALGLTTQGTGPASILRGEEEAGGWLGALSARVPHLRDVQLLLQQAKLQWSVQSYLAISAGLGVGIGLFAWVLSDLALAGLVGAVIGALLPYFYINRKKSKRLDRFEAQFPDAVDLLGRAIRAGHPLSSGLKMVAEETQEPIAGEFRQVFEEARFGLPFEDAMLGLADRVNLVDTRIFTAAVLIQREVGGNLAEILDNLSYTIRERFKIRGQVRVYTAEGRISGIILSGLPIAIGAIIFMMNPSYMMTLFTEPAGKMMIGASVVMQIMGFLWIRKIVNIEV